MDARERATTMKFSKAGRVIDEPHPPLSFTRSGS
jgi:hypothetical protein